MTGRSTALGVGLILALATMPSAQADEPRGCVDWQQLSLTVEQTQQIQVLESDWNGKYMKIQPQILENQRRLARLLPDAKSDPIEILSTQQNITRLKEQLRNEATANYLRKRAILNDSQQHQLEQQIQRLVQDKQRTAVPASQSDDQNSGFMNVIHKIRWAIIQQR